MAESEKQNGHSNLSVTDNLIQLVKQLTPKQQENLLAAIADWVEDNREYPRVDCDFEALYSDNSRLAHGMAKNISAKGVFIDPAGPFPVGQDVIISMPHPSGDEHIKIRGKIVRQDEEGMAVEFEQPVQRVF